MTDCTIISENIATYCTALTIMCIVSVPITVIPTTTIENHRFMPIESFHTG